jgi:hypothetical protein
MKPSHLIVICALCSFATPAFAQAPAPTSKPRRLVEKHDRVQSQAVKGGRVHQINTVVISGRPQRPLASIELSVERVRFPVGTARYSERDLRFLKKARGERW